MSLPRSIVAAASRLPASARAPLAFAVATLAFLTIDKHWAPLHLDTARDLLIARNCVEGIHCLHAGPNASFDGLLQGALWSHVLELRAFLGIGLVGLQRCLDVLLALGAALIPLIARRTLQKPASAITWALWISFSLTSVEYPFLWNPSPMPLALALFHGTLLFAARERGDVHFIPAGVALAAAIDLHIANAVLVPFFIGVVAATSRNPIPALFVSLTAMIGFLAVDSPGSFSHNAMVAAAHAPAVAAGLTISAAVGAAARRPLARRSDASRALIVAWSVAAFGALAMIALAKVSGHPLHARYLGPLVTPCAILAGAWLHELLATLRSPVAGKARTLAVLVGVTVLFDKTAPRRPRDTAFRVHEVEPIAAALHARGLTFGDLYQHIRGPRAFELMATLAAMDKGPLTAQASSTGEDVLVLRARRDAISTDLARRSIDIGGGLVALVETYTPFVDAARFEVCRQRPGGPRECHSARVDAGDLSETSPGWAVRAYPGIGDTARAFLDRRFAGAEMTYRMKVRIPAGAAPRRIRVFQEPEALVVWTIARVDGIPVEGSLPGRSVVLGKGGPGEGEIVFSGRVPSNAGFAFHRWLPPWVEIGEGGSALEALLPP